MSKKNMTIKVRAIEKMIIEMPIEGHHDNRDIALLFDDDNECIKNKIQLELNKGNKVFIVGRMVTEDLCK